MSTAVSLNGVSEIDFSLAGTLTASVLDGIVTLTQTGVRPTVHTEPLTDGFSNFIFASGDIIVVTGVPN